MSILTVLNMPGMDDVVETAESFSEDEGGTLTWVSPGIIPGAESLDLGLDAEGWRTSMTEPGPRCGNLALPDPSCLVDPDDPAVKSVAEHVSELTGGMPDWKRVQAALNLVQTSITYAYDDELYGVKDFWAKPAEVLYLKHGDCEDTSVLFCSIVLAMGLDAVLVDLPGHMAVGVRLGSVPGAPAEASFEHDGKTWWYCETSSDDPVKIGEREPDDDFVVRAPCDAGISGAVVSAFAWWRSIIRAATGV